MRQSKLTALVLLVNRFLQWSSAVIVVGLTSYFLHKGLRGQHSKYIEIIATTSIVFFLPAFISMFIPGEISFLVMAIDVIYSYLWLIAFVFAAEDYNWHHNCRNIPSGATCSKKYAQEAFIFLTFFFTLMGIGLEFWSYRVNNRTTTTPAPIHEKPRRDLETGPGAGGPPLDAPAEPTAHHL
ncbi:hypothetical protein OIDMADRAFT_116226 [Oidiodendron maius Zn]|uniref:MARVEL domain-containing protein n=1 Tax=Oidiodendron maius (strain Zn) TaxID=913774 RepID=A0A0C3HAQ8_OIDMZ|nr:hypothetical protein OIDMADRAFT_116226 [Oidiodendron maius Zn]